MGIFAMLFQKKRGGVSAANVESTQDYYNFNSYQNTDDVTIELAKATDDNSSAAKQLEGLLSGFLDANDKLRQGVYWLNAPSN